MSDTILGIAHFTFHPGKVDDFKRLTSRCRQIVAAHDTGTLRYDVYFDDDGSRAIVIEEYENEHALVEHGEHLGQELTDAVLATADVHGEILGSLSRDFRESLAGGPVTAYLPWRTSHQ